MPTIDLSEWIKKHTTKDDYVILKLDVEGAEFGILDKMLEDGTFEWIDKYVINSINSKRVTSPLPKLL